jgi:hypothetical protein
VRSLSRSLAKDGLGPDEAVDDKLREGEIPISSIEDCPDVPLAGRLKLACEVLSQYLPPSIKVALLKSYEYVIT